MKRIAVALTVLGLALLLCPPGTLAEGGHSSRHQTGSGGSGSTGSGGTTTAGTATADPGTYYIFANNDLGIHCACPADELMTILPPFNTIRAQVVRVYSGNHYIVTDPAKIKVEYAVPFAQNNLDDPRYQAYLNNITKVYPVAEGWTQVDANHPVSIVGTPLQGGSLTAEPAQKLWQVEGLPVFPPTQPNGGEGTFTDPFGTVRQAFPQITITVKDAGSGQVLAQRSDVTTPVAFANCCICHKEIYKDKFGYYGQPLDVFRQTMIVAHDQKHGTELDKLVDLGIPVRCSRCHSDPAVGGDTPGYPLTLYPQAAGLNLPLPSTNMTLSYVIHEGHNEKPEFHTRSAALGFQEECEACHPGKESVGCLRGEHTFKNCSDCHGDLTTRAATGQLYDPWSYRTLPRCSNCHDNMGEWSNSQIESAGHVRLGGAFLNSQGHADSGLLCSSCHGAPHALAPSKISWERNFYATFNGGSTGPINNCTKCHGRTMSGDTPPHLGD